jgi:TPR repeat protein
MKIRRVVPVLLMLLIAQAAFAQSSVTRRTTQTPGPRGVQLVPGNISSGGTQPPATTPRAVVIVPERPKTKAELEALDRRTLAFQRAQAEKGSATAQYDLGKRYLTGKGVEKDLETARHWFKLSADNGNIMSAAKLAELEKKPVEKPAEPKPEEEKPADQK